MMMGLLMQRFVVAVALAVLHGLSFAGMSFSVFRHLVFSCL